MPKLTIVIPTLNEAKYLPKLLQSIRGQTFTDYEVIVADANSKDRTVEIATRYGARVVPGGRPSVGRNAGARAGTGALILFLDADVVLPDVDFLMRIVGEFERKKLGIATAFITPLAGTITDHIFHEIYNMYVLAIQRVLPHVPGFFVFVRRSVHEAINGFDETLEFAEDHEYARRASQVGKFGFIMSTRVPVSMRRFDKEGRLTIAAKYILGELYLLREGRVPPGTMEYEWGYDKAVKKKSALRSLWQNGKFLWEKRPRSRRVK